MLAQWVLVGNTLLSLIAATIAANDSAALQCYYCLHSSDNLAVAQDRNQNPLCLNKLKFSLRPEMRRICALNEDSCSSTVVNQNGLFLTIQRDCSNGCKPGCFENGFGLFFSTCTRCCTGQLCNDYDGRAYYMPKSARSVMRSLYIAINWLVAFYALPNLQ